MTSTIVIDANSAPTVTTDPTRQPGFQQRAAGPRPRLTFGGVLRSERLKLTSLRGVRLTILLSVVVGLGLSLLIAALMASRGDFEQTIGLGDAGLQNYLLLSSTFSSAFLVLIFGVLGVFAVASEYSSGMILSTLAAVPRRTPVAFAKTIVLSILAALTALVVVVGGLGIAAMFMPDAIGQLGSSVVISGALGTIAYLALFALFAMGIAGILRSSAGAIAVVTGVGFVLPIAFQMMMMTGWEWVAEVANYLPSNLGTTLGHGLVEVASGPSYWATLGAMVIWAVVPLIPAALIFARRDAR